MSKYNLKLIKCSRTYDEYQRIRDKHYIPNNGAVGQQIHYMIYLEGEAVGIISGGSAAYAVACRDEFFGIDKLNRDAALNSIVDNTVFRLERHLPNLGTQVLAIWRRQVAKDWESKYGVKVAGFETFVVETENRKGSMYKADNWTLVGETSGSTKHHAHGAETPFARVNVEKKLVYCKWVRGGVLCDSYQATWNLHGRSPGQINFLNMIGE